MNTSIYNLVVNQQLSIIELLTHLNVDNPKDKIKNILDHELFEIIECDNSGILKIKKKSTNEIFERGCTFYSIKYKNWIHHLNFDEALFGKYYFNVLYKNYVRGTSGLYHINDISLTDNTITDVKIMTENDILTEVVSWGKQKLIHLIISNRYYLTDYDYNSSAEVLAENFIGWCKDKEIDVLKFK